MWYCKHVEWFIKMPKNQVWKEILQKFEALIEHDIVMEDEFIEDEFNDDLIKHSTDLICTSSSED